MYRGDDRDGPGILSYPDGRADVGLWKRNRLVRICSAVDHEMSLSALGHTASTDGADDAMAPDSWKVCTPSGTKTEKIAILPRSAVCSEALPY